jgi:hypothetical protein
MSKGFIALIVIIAIASIAFEIWCAFTYAGKPAGEVPFWVFWVMSN